VERGAKINRSILKALQAIEILIQILTLQAHGLRHRRLTPLAFPFLNRLKQQVNTTVNLVVHRGGRWTQRRF
jgi:DNA-binding IclR family transcriptional regulator